MQLFMRQLRRLTAWISVAGSCLLSAGCQPQFAEDGLLPGERVEVDSPSDIPFGAKDRIALTPGRELTAGAIGSPRSSSQSINVKELLENIERH